VDIDEVGIKLKVRSRTMFRKFSIVCLSSLAVLALAVPASFGQTLPPSFAPGRYQPNSQFIRPGYGLISYGLQVTQVVPWSPAARLGIEAGDIIVAVNGQSTRTMADLNRLLARSLRPARLSIIDGNTGLMNQVLVQPINGRIGVAAWPVPLNVPTSLLFR
jgi:membrane-associated protease RseP (regulator of RpoE activity)